MTDMGTFTTCVAFAALGADENRIELDSMLVDTGSEYSWIPGHLLVGLGIEPSETIEFEGTDGRIFERPIGGATAFASGRRSPTVVVFAQPGDMTLLGAHALEGMNLRVDCLHKKLVPGGPVRAAVAA